MNKHGLNMRIIYSKDKRISKFIRSDIIVSQFGRPKGYTFMRFGQNVFNLMKRDENKRLGFMLYTRFELGVLV